MDGADKTGAKFFIKAFFSKCYQIRRKLQIWLHLLKTPLMEILNEIHQRLKRIDANIAANQIFERLKNRHFLSIMPLLTIKRSQKSNAL